ncbi:imelysin family protein [Flavobacterium silvaticum]|uniref:Imelysin-like domain-containing protein n=1 Tax=Flavobacterium silvaticum TaxID=1852020 RepID=A0A972FTA4_9FLAO|nr:imelysin family protein [Flavobacterium silvaticum]NMH28088.1 hypothetical protein [Flavobacterium silvaticum]
MKKFSVSAFLLAASGIVFFASCSDDDNASPAATKATVIANYADIAYRNYLNAYDDAVALETAITTFNATPTAENFAAAKTAWLASRESYGTTEAFRFASGPIDIDENAPEGLINSWPLDEAYIDYVDGASDAGIINNPGLFPVISKQTLEDINQTENEESVSVGYHAIEFLLWGQDLTAPSANLPGQRPYTDFVDGGTASNQDRRRAYLAACADLLTDNLDYLVQQWQPSGVYRATFLALPENDALRNIFTGIVTLANSELAIERMQVALIGMDQEDEHSCFSDNTHRDIRLNLQGIINIYEGNYDGVDGPSLADLVGAANSTVYNSTETAINEAQSDMNAILTPFDLAISGGPSSVEGAKVQVTVDQLQVLGANLLAAAQAIGVTVNG